MGMKKRMTPMIWRMKKRMTPMIWRMSLILMTEKTLTTLPRSWLHLALILAVVSQHMFQGSLHLQRWILFLLIKRSLSSPTYGNEDVGISSDKHALIIPPFMGRGKRIHPMSFTDGFMTLPPRPMNPKKDLAVYGYGTVAWKERMEEWKKKQNEKLRVVKHQGGHAGGNNAGDGVDDPDLPM